MDTWLMRKCRKACLNVLIAWGAVFTICTVVAINNVRYISNFINGPYEITHDEMDNAKRVELLPRYYVKVKTNKVVPTGIEQITIRKRNDVEVERSVSAQYLALVVKPGTVLIVKTDSKEPSLFKGELTPMTSDLSRELHDLFGQAGTEIKYYPFYLDSTSYFRTPGLVALGIGMVLLLIFWSTGIPAYKYIRDINDHPLLKRVSSWGDPIELSNRIAAEYQSFEAKIGSDTKLSEHYIFQGRIFSFNLLRIEDVIWAYERVTKKRLNFVIPLGKDYEAVFVGIGVEIVCKGSEQSVDEALCFVAARNSWAIYGYTDEINRIYKNNTRELVKAVLNNKAGKG